MDRTLSSADGRCKVSSTYLREYRMGAFPERLEVNPSIAGVKDFYFMGGHIDFVEQHAYLLIWDSDDILLFDYERHECFAHSGPLFGVISEVAVSEDGLVVDVVYWTRGARSQASLALGSKQFPSGLGRVGDGIFLSAPASEHPNRVIVGTTKSRPGLLSWLFRKRDL